LKKFHKPFDHSAKSHKLKTRIMKTRINTLLTCAALSALCFNASITSANAGTAYIYSNLGSVSSTTTSNTVGYLSLAQSNHLQAQGFTMGSSDYELTSLAFGLGSSDIPAPLVQIFGNNAGTPGSPLATFSPSGSVSAKTLYTFTGSFAAQKNTSYWVVLSNTNSASQASFEWYSNDTFTQPTGTPASGITYLGTKESDNGGNWNSTLPFLSIGINGTAVPEPSALALLGLGAVGLVARRRRSA